VLRNGADGVGLYRTEFLFMDNDRLPTEDEQFEAYKIVAERLQGKPVTIRTMDIGGDKALPYMKLPHEENPFLGYRALRVCLDRKDMFKTQLRALLRSSAFGYVKIMFPMVIDLNEVRACKALLEECKIELRTEGINEANCDITLNIRNTNLDDILRKEITKFPTTVITKVDNDYKRKELARLEGSFPSDYIKDIINKLEKE
jgi:phosphoenolpyruvate-protein kinase (PTS system EI component)